MKKSSNEKHLDNHEQSDKGAILTNYKKKNNCEQIYKNVVCVHSCMCVCATI